VLLDKKKPNADLAARIETFINEANDAPQPGITDGTRPTISPTQMFGVADSFEDGADTTSGGGTAGGVMEQRESAGPIEPWDSGDPGASTEDVLVGPHRLPGRLHPSPGTIYQADGWAHFNACLVRRHMTKTAARDFLRWSTTRLRNVLLERTTPKGEDAVRCDQFMSDRPLTGTVRDSVVPTNRWEAADSADSEETPWGGVRAGQIGGILRYGVICRDFVASRMPDGVMEPQS
jgi:hypothetical protein